MSSLTGKRRLGLSPEPGGSYFLSLEESSRLAHSLRVHPPRERERARELLEKIQADWLASWSDVGLRDGVFCAVRIEDATPERSAAGGDEVTSLMYSLLFGSTRAAAELGGLRAGWQGPLAVGVAQKAGEAWLSRVRGAIGRSAVLEGETPVTASTHETPPWPWSGGLDAVFTFGSDEWRLQLSAAEVDFLLGSAMADFSSESSPSSEALSPLTEALSQRRLTVRVELKPLVLSLGQLQSLTIGDIVVLSHPLDLPAQLTVDTDEIIVSAGENPPKPLCQAWLGQSAGSMAVELHPNP